MILRLELPAISKYITENLYVHELTFSSQETLPTGMHRSETYLLLPPVSVYFIHLFRCIFTIVGFIFYALMYVYLILPAIFSKVRRTGFCLCMCVYSQRTLLRGTRM